MKLAFALLCLLSLTSALNGRLKFKSTPYWNEIRDIVTQINLWVEDIDSLVEFTEDWADLRDTDRPIPGLEGTKAANYVCWDDWASLDDEGNHNCTRFGMYRSNPKYPEIYTDYIKLKKPNPKTKPYDIREFSWNDELALSAAKFIQGL